MQDKVDILEGKNVPGENSVEKNAASSERSSVDSPNSSSGSLSLNPNGRLRVEAFGDSKRAAKVSKNTETAKRAAQKIINEGGIRRKIRMSIGKSNHSTLLTLTKLEYTMRYRVFSLLQSMMNITSMEIDGVLYRVKTTIKRYNSENEKTKAYSYEVTEIELLDGSGIPHTQSADFIPTSNNSITLAKLLKGVKTTIKKANIIDSTSLYTYEITKIEQIDGKTVTDFSNNPSSNNSITFAKLVQTVENDKKKWRKTFEFQQNC